MPFSKVHEWREKNKRQPLRSGVKLKLSFVFPSVGSNLHSPVPTKSPANSTFIDLASTIVVIFRKLDCYSAVNRYVKDCALTGDWFTRSWLRFTIRHPPIVTPPYSSKIVLLTTIGGLSMTASSRTASGVHPIVHSAKAVSCSKLSD